MHPGRLPPPSQALGAQNFHLAGVWFLISLAVVLIGNVPAMVGFCYIGPMLRALGFSEAVCQLGGSFGKLSIFWLVPNGWYQW